MLYFGAFILIISGRKFNILDDICDSLELIILKLAPPGYRVSLDFLGTFQVEASEFCRNDFLEVRDGPFGYSEGEKHFCGTRMPQGVISSDRFLWLRFVSDDSIEMQGFHAVLSFVSSLGISPHLLSRLSSYSTSCFFLERRNFLRLHLQNAYKIGSVRESGIRLD